MQYGSQYVLTLKESSGGKIVGLAYGSKLCHEGTRMIREKQKPLCPNHDGCTATMNQLEPIGQEDKQAEQAIKSLKEAGMEVTEITTDGDSKLAAGVRKHFPQVKSLKDNIHFAKTQENAVKKATFSKGMFIGTADMRKKKQRWFAKDIRRRCTAEFNKSYHRCKKIKDDEQRKKKMNAYLRHVPHAILKCIQGDCSMCPKHSLVCRGKPDKNFRQKLDLTDKLTLSKADKSTLMPILLKRLGPEAIGLTHKNTTTQRSEAFNKKLTAYLPKSSTFIRTYRGRTSMALLDHNLGFGRLMNRILHTAGHSVSEEIKKRIDMACRQLVYWRAYHAQRGIKRARALKRSGLFHLYRQIKHNSTTYKKDSTTFKK